MKALILGGMVLVAVIALTYWKVRSSERALDEATQSVAREAATVAPLAAPEPIRLPRIAVKAEQIAADYKTNELAADDQYKDRDLRVVGSVARIIKSAFGEPVVVLKGIGFANDVRCYFPADTTARLSRLVPKNRVVFDCDKAHMTIGSVVLKDCSWPYDEVVDRENPGLRQ